MRNYWKQFEEWATALKLDLFFWTRLKLMVLYVVTLTILLFGFNQIIQLSRNPETTVAPSPHLLAYIIDAATGGLSRTSVFIFIGILGASFVTSYFLTDVTLRPLRQIMQRQKRFIADASHELRTPLSIMKTNSEVALLDGGSLNPQEALTVTKSNLEEINRMSNILQNLLNLSQIDKRTVDMPFTKVNLLHVVEQSIRSVEPLALRKKITLSLFRADSAMLWGNTTGLEEMTVNLLKNAITYTPEGGQVSASVKHGAPERIELSIRDTGIGISAKDLPHIFEPFYKADTSRIRREGGSSGLGLTIVREIIKRHHGSIYIKSAVGKGTRVTILFPLSQGVRVWEN